MFKQNCQRAPPSRSSIFEMFNPDLHKALGSLALRHALDDDDLTKLVTDTAMIVETYKVYFHGGNISRVLEKDVQGWYAISWGSLKYEFVPEQPTSNG